MAYCKLPRVRLQLFGYLFSPAWLPTLMAALFFVIFMQLAFWQLHRAHEKKLLEEEFAHQTGPLTLSQITHFQDRNLHYRPLKVTGFFDNTHLIYVDNKTYQGQVGFHVFSPFIIPSEKKVLLVNRGFVRATTRDVLPTVTSIKGLRTLSGLIYFPSKSFMLAQESMSNRWPILLQNINVNRLKENLHVSFYPFYLLLQKGDDEKLIRDWHPVNFPSYRHIGYAVQWFLLALTVLIIYFKLNISRLKDD